MGSATKLAFSVFLISCSSGEYYSSHLSGHTPGTAGVLQVMVFVLMRVYLPYYYYFVISQLRLPPVQQVVSNKCWQS